MKIYVTGFSHLEGVSKKTGNPYNFYQVETLSRRNQGVGSPLMAYQMAIQAPAFENILSELVNEKSNYPLLLSAEFDNHGSLVEVDFLKDGDEAAASLLDVLLA